MAYYQRLRDLKEDADLTQKQVADLIGVSTNHYGKYERGETDIPLGKAIILARYYGVSLDYLAGLTNNREDQKKANKNTVVFEGNKKKFIDVQVEDVCTLAVQVNKLLKNCDPKICENILKKSKNREFFD